MSRGGLGSRTATAGSTGAATLAGFEAAAQALVAIRVHRDAVASEDVISGDARMVFAIPRTRT